MTSRKRLYKKRSNRNKISQWFITFPQWKPDLKAIIVDTISVHFELVYYKIAQETHEDGNFHYHLVIKLATPVSKSALLKIMKQDYPDDYKRIDIKAVRSIKSSMKYIDKEDPTPLEHPDGYKEPRTPLQWVYRKTLLDWAMFRGFDSIEEYMESKEMIEFLEAKKKAEEDKKNQS